MTRPARRGVSLIELMVGATLATLLLLFLGYVSVGGFKTSTKGTAHLSNAHAASIFLRGLESDMGRAVSVRAQNTVVAIDVVSQLTGGRVGTDTIMYVPGQEDLGFVRQAQSGEPVKFCADLKFEPVSADTPMFCLSELSPGGRKGIRVRFRVLGKKADAEKLVLERFLLCGNASDNQQLPGWVQ